MESDDAPQNSEPEPEPTLSALVAETCSSMLDAVAIIDRIEAKQEASKVEFLDQARRIAETTNHGLVTVGSTLTPTQQREMVRRSFVAEVAGVLRIPEVTAVG
jgi:signal transduction histidine kinase